MVSVLAFYSDDPSSNPAEAYNFSVNFVFEKNQNKQKEAGVGHFLKKNIERLDLNSRPLDHESPLIGNTYTYRPLLYGVIPI